MSPKSTKLTEEAQALLNRLGLALYELYENHPTLGDVPKPGTGRQRLRIKRIKERARRRLVRRIYAAGSSVPIRGAMMFINQADSGYF